MRWTLRYFYAPTHALENLIFFTIFMCKSERRCVSALGKYALRIKLFFSLQLNCGYFHGYWALLDLLVTNGPDISSTIILLGTGSKNLIDIRQRRLLKLSRNNLCVLSHLFILPLGTRIVYVLYVVFEILLQFQEVDDV